MSFKNIALIGNPNSGKTRLFNLLTGQKQKVGNWAGVTVEKKQGSFNIKDDRFNIVDLPGTYTINNKIPSLDEKVTQDFIKKNPNYLYLNIVDSSNLERAIYLTSELREAGVEMIILLNMMDISEKKGVTIDVNKLKQTLGCEIIPMSLQQGFNLNTLYHTITNYHPVKEFVLDYHKNDNILQNSENKIIAAKKIAQKSTNAIPIMTTLSDKIDDIVVGKFSGVLVFLAVIYLLFLFSINFGGAFIDFFDILSGAIFIDGFKEILAYIRTPEIIQVVLADGIGSGIQVVATFIPVMFALYLFLSILEESGYMARAAFVMDRFMRKIGLSGKVFVPLIVGFGCNVPGIMATRTLDKHNERITTILMLPFMSCGARLAVYALFAAAFFPENGTNIVFLLYLIGIIFAVATGFILKSSFESDDKNILIMEIPSYQTPHIKDVFINTWNKLKGFIIGAGKIIIIVVACISIFNNIGTDGSFDNNNSKNSMLSQSAQTITPAFKPMGIDDENWPAIVGIITGVLAKEVVVGTLDSLYSPDNTTHNEFSFKSSLNDAIDSIGNNLKDSISSMYDPLGLEVIAHSSLQNAAKNQEVNIKTFNTMVDSFNGKIGAFAYLLFILLYFPCVAALGAMMREAGNKWGIIGAAWTTVLAYSVATIFYQTMTFIQHPMYSSIWIIICLITLIVFIIFMQKYAKNYNKQYIDIITKS